MTSLADLVLDADLNACMDFALHAAFSICMVIGCSCIFEVCFLLVAGEKPLKERANRVNIGLMPSLCLRLKRKIFQK